MAFLDLAKSAATISGDIGRSESAYEGERTNQPTIDFPPINSTTGHYEDHPHHGQQQQQEQHQSEQLVAAAGSHLYATIVNLTTPVTETELGFSTVPQCGIVCSPEYILQIATAITVCLAAVGTVGNILTILAITTSNLRHNINSILICNLSVADAVYCGLVLPLQANAFHQRGWTMGGIVCELQAALRIWLIGVNMMLLSFIALYRYFHVVQPHLHSKYSQMRWFLSACALCWAFPAVFSLTPLLNLWGKFDFQEQILQCTFAVGSSASHKLTTITMGYLIPCAFISTCYARIGCVVCRTRRRAVKLGSIYRRQRARRESYRLTGMMVLIFLGFLLGTTPYFVVNSVDKGLKQPVAHLVTPVLAWVMYGTHPLIYTVMDAKFQNAYRRLLAWLIGAKHLAPPALGPDTSVHAADNHKRNGSTKVKGEEKEVIVEIEAPEPEPEPNMAQDAPLNGST